MRKTHACEMPVRFKREFPWLESFALTIGFLEKLVALLS